MGCEHSEHLGIAEDETLSAVKKDFFELVGDVVLEGLAEGQSIPVDTEVVEAVDDTGGFGIDLLADA
jgi:predicted ThiF/HesA family dinucleotide-utilizing enzyme